MLGGEILTQSLLAQLHTCVSARVCCVYVCVCVCVCGKKTMLPHNSHICLCTCTKFATCLRHYIISDLWNLCLSMLIRSCPSDRTKFLRQKTMLPHNSHTCLCTCTKLAKCLLHYIISDLWNLCLSMFSRSCPSDRTKFLLAIYLWWMCSRITPVGLVILSHTEFSPRSLGWSCPIDWTKFEITRQRSGDSPTGGV